MVLKRIAIGFRMSDTVIGELYRDYPSILKHDERGSNETILIVDVTPTQESQIIPVLKDKLVKIEDIPGGIWPTI
jgi:hypothetical protein